MTKEVVPGQKRIDHSVEPSNRLSLFLWAQREVWHHGGAIHVPAVAISSLRRVQSQIETLDSASVLITDFPIIPATHGGSVIRRRIRLERRTHTLGVINGELEILDPAVCHLAIARIIARRHFQDT